MEYKVELKFKVRNNETGNIREFNTIEGAIKWQEYCVFVLGKDVEVL